VFVPESGDVSVWLSERIVAANSRSLALRKIGLSIGADLEILRGGGKFIDKTLARYVNMT
jgi:hypothetical protein